MNHIYSLKRSTEVAIWTASRNGSTTGSNITITDAAAAPAVDLRIYGRTSDGHSVGENGLTVTATGKNIFPTQNVNVEKFKDVSFSLPAGSYDISFVVTSTDIDTNESGILLLNTNGDIVGFANYTRGTRINKKIVLNQSINRIRFMASDTYAHSEGDTATFSDIMVCKSSEFIVDYNYVPYVTPENITVTTALPLRSNGDVKDEIDFKAGVAITRISSEGTVLETPVTTPLSSAEITAFNAFALFAGYTNITATDDPTMYIEYQKAAPTRKNRRRTSKKK